MKSQSKISAVSSVSRVRSCRVFNTIPIVRFTSPWPPALAPSTFKIETLAHKVLTHHQPDYLSELIVEHQPVYNVRSEDNNLLVIPRKKTKIASRAFRVCADHMDRDAQ